MKIYMACPAAAVSGGAELLHQFSQELTKRNVENYMLYYGDTSGSPTPEHYRKYNVKTAARYVDDADSVFVLPEVGVHEAMPKRQSVHLVAVREPLYHVLSRKIFNHL